MAGLWIPNRDGKPGEAAWSRFTLQAGKNYALDPLGGAPSPSEGSAPAPETKSRILLICDRNASEARWVLLAPSGAVYVNGLPLMAGIRVMRDRDEIACGGVHRVFLTYADPAQVVAFPGDDHEVRCARCRRVLQVGEPVVRCPNPACGAWHHQDPESELDCWTYAAQCAACDQETALDGAANWSPEAISGVS